MARAGWAAGVGALLWLAGCGGGGGGADPVAPDGPPPVAGREQPLAFSAQNVGFVAGYSLFAPTALVGVANQIVAGVQRLAEFRGLATEGQCSAGGSYRLTVADADADGQVSAGDRIDFEFAGCAIDSGGDVYTGRASAVVQAMDATARRALSAEVVIGAGGLRLDSAPFGAGFATLQGGLRLDWQRDLLSARLTIASRAADDLRRVDGARIDAWTAVQIEKRVRHDAARIELQVSLRQASDDLGGSFEVRTPVAIRSHLNTLPEADPAQGRLEIVGAQGDRVAVRVGLPGQPELLADLDIGGDGRVDGAAQGTWENLSAAALWRDFGDFGREPAAVGATPFAVLLGWEVRAAAPIDEPLRLQFNRVPLDTSALRFRLIDGGRVDQAVVNDEVPIRVRHEGALVLLEPEAPLRYSRRYRVEIRQGDGGGEVRVAGPDLQQARLPAASEFVSPDRLRPVLTPLDAPAPSIVPPLAAGEVMRLSAVQSIDLRHVVGYAWSQVDGPPLEFATPSSPETALRLRPGGEGIGAATVRLTLTHHDGRSESSDLRIKTVASLPATGWWHRVRVPVGAAGAPLTEWAAEGTGLSIGGTLSDDGRSLGVGYEEATVTNNRWSFGVAARAGERLQPGRYEGALDATAALVQQGLAPRLDALVMSRTCLPSSGWFEIFEIEHDGSGQLTRLALDLELRCGGPEGPITSASLRLNSTRPPP